MNLALQGSPVVHLALAVGSIPGNEEFALYAITALVARGAALDCLDDRRRTALHLAAEYDLSACAHVLLENGARSTIEQVDRQG